MAIVPSCPGLTVEVLVKGKALEEFPDHDEDQDHNGDSSTVYVEATDNTQFAIMLTFTPTFKQHTFSAKIYIDDNWVTWSTWNNHKFRTRKYKTFNGKYSRIGSKTFKHHFMFTALNIVEDSPETSDPQSSAPYRLGKIAVIFQKIENVREVAWKDTPLRESDDTKISEKSIKGICATHKLGFGRPKRVPKGSFKVWDNIGQPFATFNFNYRSRDALKSLLVIPRTPSPVPLEERPEDELSQGELRELVRKLKEQRETDAAKIKEEYTLKRDRSVDIKTEHDEVTFVESRSTKRPRGENDEVIVLD